MNTHESYVSLEVAKLLKQAGFDWEISTCYYKSSPDKVSGNGTLTADFNGYAFQHIAISAPTLAIAQRWLREVKNCHVVPTFSENDYFYQYGYSIFHGPDWLGDFLEEEHTLTYETVLEAGIKKCLELILRENEQGME